jgi:hypothetical protein
MAADFARQVKLPLPSERAIFAALLVAQYGSGPTRSVVCLIVLKPAHFEHPEPQNDSAHTFHASARNIFPLFLSKP